MEILKFMISQCISFLVGVLSGLSANYIDKIKNHSRSTKTESGFEFNYKSQRREFKIKRYSKK